MRVTQILLYFLLYLFRFVSRPIEAYNILRVFLISEPFPA